ncbi:hypothetical protein ALC56_02536 [Trachymyrmex septentrionalis]|uniref:Uncharacterized protein n=1 Tax=Trachymyrmex septentrionalis TaxID=34720 RepID=A0A195FS58_9HYME|nr:hypothetical protein ALC56_02536 [Trachymyrmex septentrionalis]
MACYFIWITIELRELFNIILIENYKKSKIMAITLWSFYLSHQIFKFLLVNYMCETISTKANATANLLNRLSCTTCDVEIREIVSLKINS